MLLKNYKFHDSSLIELVVYPDMNISRILKAFKSDEQFIFIDTKGNLSYQYNATEIFTIEEFEHTTKTLIQKFKLGNKEKFILFIDSVTFFADTCEFYKTIEIYGLLWELIYETNCTIVAVNHYKMVGNNNFVPRLGIMWYRVISYRILYKWKDGNVVYEIYKLF